MNLCALISREHEAPLKKALAATGHTLLDTCVDGKDGRSPNTAIQSQMNGQPDVLIIDLTTSLQYPWLAIHRVRLGAPDTRIILIDGDESNPIFPTCVSVGIFDFVIVADPDDLADQIATAINHPANYKSASKYTSAAAENESAKAPSVNRVKKPIEEIHIVEERPIGRISIGVAGTLPRIGCTTTSIFIARTLAEKGMRVALWMANREHYSYIHDSYDDVQEHDENHFTLDGVDFHTGDLGDIGDYPYIVHDLGILNDANHAELKRAQVKILLSGNKDWELPALGTFLDNAETNGEKIRNYLYFFLHATPSDVKEIRRSMKGMECISVPTVYNPFTANAEFTGIVETILQPYLPSTYQKPTKRSIFGRK